MSTFRRNDTSPKSFGARLRRLRAELNNTRLTLLVALLFTMLVAAIFPTPAIRFMVALLCAGPFVSAAMARFFGRSIRASRFLPETVGVGETFTGRVELWNIAPHPVFFAQILAGETQGSPGEVPPLEVTGGDHLTPILRAGERLTLTPQWQAHRRGVWTLPPVVAGASDPMGLSTFLAPHTGAQQLVVLPRAIPLMRLGFLADAASGTRGFAHATAVAEALEFHGIRAWRPGEGIRRVHWKSTARTGQLHVIEWEEDLSSDVSVLLDTQISPGLHAGALNPGLETAITLAASIAAQVLDSGQTFEFFCWHQDAAKSELQHLHHRARGASGLAATMRQLAQAQTVGATAQLNDVTSLEHLVKQCVSDIASDSSILLVSLDKVRVAAAQNSLETAGVPMRRCTAIVIESETATPNPITKKHSRSDTDTEADMKSGLDSGVLSEAKSSGMRTRTFHPGDSLTAFLEKEL